MTFSEVILVLVVALIAFGPKQLSHLCYTLGKILKQLDDFRGALLIQWHDFLKQQTLQEHEDKASLADKAYKEQEKKI